MDELKNYLKEYTILLAYDLGDKWVAAISESDEDPEDVYDNYVEVNKKTGKILGFSIAFDPRSNEVNDKTLIYKR